MPASAVLFALCDGLYFVIEASLLAEHCYADQGFFRDFQQVFLYAARLRPACRRARFPIALRGKSR